MTAATAASQTLDPTVAWDALVIGGGATGAGLLRDLARRGMRSLLVDRSDLGTGTSGRYHGLLHSGARYVARDRDAARECIVENRVMRRIAAFPAPSFAAVQGACLGVGLGLAIATDVVYVAEDAKTGSPFVNLGAMLDSGAHALLYERLGAHRALDLIYTGELLTGAEAVSAGLFSRAVPPGELREFTRERARRAAAGPTQALLASKRLIDRLRDDGLWRVVAEETRGQAELRDSADYREGFAAFQAKRTPSFTGE